MKAPGNFLKEYAEFLKDEVQRYEGIIEDLLNRITQMSTLMQLPPSGVYMRSFFGKGGNQFFLSDLATSLQRNYPNVPPFHRGDEYVAGVIYLIGGPQLIVEQGLTLLGLIFGAEDASEISELIDSVGPTVATAERMLFGDDLTVTTTTPTAEDFDEALQPLVLCQPEETTTITFGENLEPV